MYAGALRFVIIRKRCKFVSFYKCTKFSIKNDLRKQFKKSFLPVEDALISKFGSEQNG